MPSITTLAGSGTAAVPTSAASPVSVKPVPMVPTSSAVPVDRLIVNNCEAPPVGAVREAKAMPLIPETSKPTRSEVSKPRPVPMVVSRPLLESTWATSSRHARIFGPTYAAEPRAAGIPR